MPSGIYQLEFETGERYIGQSVDITQRWQQHVISLQKGRASALMQKAYTNSGCELPRASIIIECHPDLLNLYEGMFINLWSPELNTSVPERRSNEDYDILDKFARTKNGMLCSLPSLMDTAFTLQNKYDEACDSLNELEIENIELSSNVDNAAYIELTKMEQYGALVSELKKYKDMVESASWWNRLWKIW